MSQSIFADSEPRRWGDSIDTEAVITSPTEIETLLGLLDDSDCREILDATSETARSATELSEVCDIPPSTIYRKVDLLTDAGLLDEGVRLRRNGKHTNEYVRAIEGIEVSVDDDGFTASVILRQPDERTVAPPLLTSG